MIKRLKKAMTPDKRVMASDLFWLFIIGSVVGFVLEGLWCIVLRGAWENHSATLWGPFCIIYGVGADMVYLIANKLEGKSLRAQFISFAISGAAVEYFGGLFQEICFGCISWDYSADFMNLGGRVSLLTTIVWGVLGMMFVKLPYPYLKKLLTVLHSRRLNVLCAVMAVFMAHNLAWSGAAVRRWGRRIEGKPPVNAIEEYLDERYDDTAMRKTYPNMRFRKNNQAE